MFVLFFPRFAGGDENVATVEVQKYVCCRRVEYRRAVDRPFEPFERFDVIEDFAVGCVPHVRFSANDVGEFFDPIPVVFVREFVAVTPYVEQIRRAVPNLITGYVRQEFVGEFKEPRIVVVAGGGQSEAVVTYGEVAGRNDRARVFYAAAARHVHDVVVVAAARIRHTVYDFAGKRLEILAVFENIVKINFGRNVRSYEVFDSVYGDLVPAIKIEKFVLANAPLVSRADSAGIEVKSRLQAVIVKGFYESAVVGRAVVVTERNGFCFEVGES